MAKLVKFHFPSIGTGIGQRLSEIEYGPKCWPPNAVGYLPALEVDYFHFGRWLRIIQILFTILLIPHSNFSMEQLAALVSYYRPASDSLRYTVRNGCIVESFNAWLQRVRVYIRESLYRASAIPKLS